MITNADQGVLLSLGDFRSNNHLITISGATASNVTLPSQIQLMQPVLQAQDGTFFGVVEYDWDSNDVFMASFDTSGNIKWTAPNYYAQIATADGGVVAGSYDANGRRTGQSFTFDANGNATGQVGSLPIQSWTGSGYRYGSTVQVVFTPTTLATSFWAFAAANASGIMTAAVNYEPPQVGLRTVANSDLTVQPACSTFLDNLTAIAISNGRDPAGPSFTKTDLLTEIRRTATAAMDYISDGPSSNTIWEQCTQPNCIAKFPVWFTGVEEPQDFQVKQLFQQYNTTPYLEGLSQYNGYAIWLRVINDWSGAWMGANSQYIHTFSSKSGQVNSYGLGTLLHEVLHKKSVGGGFTHDNLSTALGISFCGDNGRAQNSCSVAIANSCFPNN
jgi:hypothetical protein